MVPAPDKVSFLNTLLYLGSFMLCLASRWISVLFQCGNKITLEWELLLGLWIVASGILRTLILLTSLLHLAKAMVCNYPFTGLKNYF